VAAIKVKDHDWGYVDPNRGLEETDLLMVLLEKKDINKWR
jgi:trk system potassium uptake protein TrkA